MAGADLSERTADPLGISASPSEVPGREPAAAASLVCVNPLEDATWDTWAGRHADFCFFHSRAWAAVLHEAFGYTPRYFVARSTNTLAGALCVMEAQSLIEGRRGVALPFTDFCPLLATDEPSSRTVLNHALACGRQRRWRYLEWRGSSRFVQGAHPSLTFLGHTLRLDASVEDLFNRCDAPVRRAVRKAQREGVRVEFSSDLPALHQFYELYCETRRKHGLPPQSKRFFEAIHRHVLNRGQGLLGLARHREVPIAGALFCHAGRKAVFKYGASRQRFLPLRGNNLVMWEAIKWHAQHGFAELHFGRTSLSNAGLRSFKLGWGAQEHRLEYFRYDLRRGRYLTVPDAASGWHNAFFRLLPLPLARLIGASLYRHWA